MVSRFTTDGKLSGAVSTAMQANGQTRRNVDGYQGVAECQLASTESVAGLLTQLRGFVQVATVDSNGSVERRYLAGERVWQVRSRE